MSELIHQGMFFIGVCLLSFIIFGVLSFVFAPFVKNFNEESILKTLNKTSFYIAIVSVCGVFGGMLILFAFILMGL